MANREYWIQVENKLWDIIPNGVNRMTGEMFHSQDVEQINYEIDGRGRTRESGRSQKQMVRPVEVLIFRRYSPPDDEKGISAWSQPLDRKVNPWDLNEPDPRVTGGTLPGATLECDVGDRITVHFRNMDLRHQDGVALPVELRMHSLHPHGITFAPRHDGAYPISPFDRDQPIVGEEKNLYKPFGIRHFHDGNRNFFKRSDLVPPGGQFTYQWDTRAWSTTAGVWLYHDHSVADHHNVLLGAIGFLIIHDPRVQRDVNLNFDNEDVISSELPDGDPNGDIVVNDCYVAPPVHSQCLQLYHELQGVGMTINGRQNLGNTPTMVVGTETLIRFGLGAMNNNTFHTFHLHGHRWPGEAGPGSPTVDTKIFGPANTFSFSIQEGSDEGPPPDESKGEWHMHCHVLHHMMGGMMGSLLIVEEGDKAVPLQQGVRIPHVMPTLPPQDDTRLVEIREIDGSFNTAEGEIQISSGNLTAILKEQSVTITIMGQAFHPREIEIKSGTVVQFHFQEAGHTVTTKGLGGNLPLEINGGTPGDPVPRGRLESRSVNAPNGTVLSYYCGIHGRVMAGVIRVL